MKTRSMLWALALAALTFVWVTPAVGLTRVAVVTDRRSYSQGATVTVSATYRGTLLNLVVRRPDGSTAVNTVIRPVSTGRMNYRYQVKASAPGTWTAALSDPGKAYGSVRWTVAGSPVSPPPSTPPTTGAGPHASLSWAGYPSNCRGCHAEEFSEMYGSLHYQWQAPAPDNTNKPGTLPGKATNALNSYCISPLGNWKTCGKCHTGRGAQPVLTTTPSTQQLDNIDCLVCHNDSYALARVRRADGSMGPTSTVTSVLDGYVRNIAKPTRTTCLKCHAFAGGGDSYKRGDITWAHKATTDRRFDVHMATTGANLRCQSCHTFVAHKVTGKGSDLQSTDQAAEIACTKCHASKGTATGHATSAVGSHVARVACQTCHIPTYARNASDTAASEATEIDRDWRTPGSAAIPFHPTIVTANNLAPKYRWWNRKSTSYLLGDSASLDASTGAYATSRPVGSVSGPLGNKLYPFKYKTATQPMRTLGKVLVALDTNEYMNVSGNPLTSVTKGLVNMGFSATDPFTWVKTDTYQLLNHEVPPAAGNALTCTSCHGSTARMNLKRDLGYALKGPQSTVCVQCHGPEDDVLSFTKVHEKHVTDKRYDCSFCHTFSRPERGLRTTR